MMKFLIGSTVFTALLVGTLMLVGSAMTAASTVR